jgi:hypothetical protein
VSENDRHVPLGPLDCGLLSCFGLAACAVSTEGSPNHHPFRVGWSWPHADTTITIKWRFGSKYGFIDRTGKTVIPAQFDLTFGFSEGLAAVEVGKRWGFTDTTGKMVIPPQDFSDVKPFHNGVARVVVQKRGVGHIGYIDRTGKFVWGPHAQSDKADD